MLREASFVDVAEDTGSRKEEGSVQTDDEATMSRIVVGHADMEGHQADEHRAEPWG